MSRDLVNFERVVRARRSVRAFRAAPISREVIERIVGLASCAPSSCNTQPWSLHIVSGERLAALRCSLLQAATAGLPPTPEVALAAPYQGVFRERQVEAAVNLFNAQGIDRGDRKERFDSFLRNYEFFGAPHAAFVFMTSGGGLREAEDCGKFIQTFLLAVAAAGLEACPQGSLSHYPEIVRETLNLIEPGRLLLGISFGYADTSQPTAAVASDRSALASLCSFH